MIWACYRCKMSGRGDKRDHDVEHHGAFTHEQDAQHRKEERAHKREQRKAHETHNVTDLTMIHLQGNEGGCDICYDLFIQKEKELR